jgi:hypothetical protein
VDRNSDIANDLIQVIEVQIDLEMLGFIAALDVGA